MQYYQLLVSFKANECRLRKCVSLNFSLLLFLSRPFSILAVPCVGVCFVSCLIEYNYAQCHNWLVVVFVVVEFYRESIVV